MTRALLLILAVMVLGTIGCGESEDDGPPDSRPATGITAEDFEILARIQGKVRAWNRTATPWVEAFGGDDVDRFLAEHRRALRPLHVAVSGIEGGALQIGDPDLRRRLRSIADLYRDEYDVILEVGDHVIAGDFEASQRAATRLRRISRRKGEHTEELVDEYPELGREF